MLLLIYSIFRALREELAQKPERNVGVRKVLPVITGKPRGAALTAAASLRRTRHIGYFRAWKDHDQYQKAFDRLLSDLKA